MCKFQIFPCSIHREIPKNLLSELCEERNNFISSDFVIAIRILSQGSSAYNNILCFSSCDCISFQAGIEADQLWMALEPEAASIYCQHLHLERDEIQDDSFMKDVKSGKQYMVVDLGGMHIKISSLKN